MDEQIRKALEAAHHELTTLHGLYAFDTTRPYTDAVHAGSDADGAWEAFQEETWQIDTTAVLRQIEAILGCPEQTGQA